MAMTKQMWSILHKYVTYLQSFLIASMKQGWREHSLVSTIDVVYVPPPSETARVKRNRPSSDRSH
eukprot:COSAG06_NODE_4084_length_4591_cov_2.794524_1_plen_65_part_00